MRLLTAHARANVGFLKDLYGILEVSLLYRGTEMLILTKNLAAYQDKAVCLSQILCVSVHSPTRVFHRCI